MGSWAHSRSWSVPYIDAPVSFLVRRGELTWNAVYLASPALLLGFDAPWQVGLAVRVEDVIIDLGVDVFRVDEEAVYVEDAGADRAEGGFVDLRLRHR